ncbi:unnamed protein product [Rotaria magnacalcarata]|uniref:Uncharacterized protein n=1 Tax=Rotaria magnacalcarata TaxID=392030 RepID=A0A816N5J6_9BILA|nr:unnamed protein product [Rotaria magnacalcarata]
MALNGTLLMPYANTITVTTGLSSCDNTTLNLNQTVIDLANLYRSNISNITSNFFLNVSISNFNCSATNDMYFQQVITVIQSISIRIQILFASIYYDYINASNYVLNGFIIDQESYFNLSSITINNSLVSDACTASDIAQDPICLANSSYPICILQSNRWTANCSDHIVTTTTLSSISIIMNNNSSDIAAVASGLNSWQIGLACGLSVLFALLIILTVGYFIRRYTHSKKIALSHVNIYNDEHLMYKGEKSQSQAFKRTKTIVQPKQGSKTTIPWIYEGDSKNDILKHKNCIHIKPPEPFNQVTFVDHTKIHDPGFSSNLPLKPIASVSVPTSPSNITVSRAFSTPATPRPISRTSMNQLKAITDGLQEDKLNDSDNISLNQFWSDNQKKPNAWMPILDVVNAELAMLDEQDRKSSLT